jgi:hypothetical protein
VDGVTRRNSGPIIESPRSCDPSSRRKKRTRGRRHCPSAEANKYGALKARLPSRCLRQTLTFLHHLGIDKSTYVRKVRPNL